MKGFTLIEVIITTAIIGLLSGIMFVNFRGVRESIGSRQSAQNIAQSIRVLQNRAFGGVCSISPCRFGAHFDVSTTAFLIFEDRGATFNGQYDMGEEIETVALEENIVILSLSLSYACSASLCADVLFGPPDPVISFKPASAAGLTISITGGKSVTIGSGGSVDVN